MILLKVPAFGNFNNPLLTDKEYVDLIKNNSRRLKAEYAFAVN